MRKFLMIALMMVGISALAQDDVVETIFYKDGVETITKSYSKDGISYLDLFIDGNLKNRTQVVDGLSVTVGFEVHKRYGQYIAANVLISNNSSDTFHIVPSRNIKGYNVDSKGKGTSFLTQKDYQKIVKRRQNGNMVLMAFAQGVASYNDGVTTIQTSGQVNTTATGGGSFNAYSNYGSSVSGNWRSWGSANTSYSSTTRIYNAAEARAMRQQRAAEMSAFADAQSAAFSIAKESYLKSNTLEPGQSTGGHILISTRGLSKKNIATYFTITVNGRDFEFKKRFIRL